MIKIDLTTHYMLLDKTPDTKQTLGQILANTLATANDQKDPLKFLGWAERFYGNEIVEVDESDFKKLRDFVSNHKTLFVLAQGQVLRKLDECEKYSK